MVDFSQPVTSPEHGDHSGYDQIAGARQTGQNTMTLPVSLAPSSVYILRI
jgi:hypothetical protein